MGYEEELLGLNERVITHNHPKRNIMKRNQMEIIARVKVEFVRNFYYNIIVLGVICEIS